MKLNREVTPFLRIVDILSQVVQSSDGKFLGCLICSLESSKAGELETWEKTR